MRRLGAVLLLTSWLAGQQPSGSGAQADDKCSIEGTVVNAITGDPLNKVHLMLLPVDLGSGTTYGAATDAAGHFLMDQLDPGRYTFQASRNGFVAQSYSPDGNPRRLSPLTLASGQKMKELVFKLTPQGVVIGRVIDEDGEPLAGVNIQPLVLQYQRGRRQLQPAGSTSTNDSGEFRLHNLAPGKYVITAWLTPRNILLKERVVGSARSVPVANEGYVATYYPSAPNPDNAAQVEISPGAQISGINIALVRTHTVSVKGHASVPVKESGLVAAVSLMARDSSILLPNQPTPAGAIDTRGNFEIRGVPSGSYLLRSTYTVDGKSYAARQPLEVRDSDIEGIELTLQPPLELSGHLVIEDGADLHGASLSVLLSREQPFGGAAAQVKNDLTFTMQNLQRDSYDISVQGLPQDFYLKSVSAGGQDVTETGIELAGGAPEDLTVTINQNGGVVEGSVQNGKDEPAAEALVTLIPNNTKSQSIPGFYKTAYTDQNGHFTLHGVRPGDYKIYAWEDAESDAYQDPDFVKPHESAGEALSIKERAHENVQLKLIPAEDSADAPAAR
jgi:hypothetical protein